MAIVAVSRDIPFTANNLKATNAQGTADTAKDTADTAKSTADAAKSTADAAKDKADDVAEQLTAVSQTADGKNSVYEGTSVPTSGTYKTNDLFFLKDSDGVITGLYKYDGSQWVNSIDVKGINDSVTAANEAASNAKSVGDAAQQTANDAKTQAESASSDAVDAKDVAEQAQTVANDAKSTAQAAQTTANGRNRIFRQASQPTASAAGDVWFDTDNGNQVAIWDGSAWQPSKFGSAAIGTLDAGAITTGTLDASKATVMNINASNISTGTLNAARIGSDSIDASKINVSTLSAISANLGNVTAGNITGVNIKGSFFTALGKDASGHAGKDTVLIGKSNNDPSILIQSNDKSTDKAMFYSGVISCQNEEAYNILHPYGFDANQKNGDNYDSVSLDTTTITMYKASQQKVYINNSGEIDVAGPITSGGIAMNGGHTLHTTDGTGLTVQDDTGAKMVFTADSTSHRIWAEGIYERTSGGGDPVYVTNQGTLHRQSSATKYKESIEPVDTANGYAERILQLQPKSWHYKADDEAAARDVGVNDPDEDYNIDRDYGLVAEDVARVGLPEYVSYGPRDISGNREIENIKYDRLWTLLIPIDRNQNQEINLLKTRVGVLETILKQKGIVA